MRVEALLRRSGSGAVGKERNSYCFGDIEVDLGSRVVRRAGTDVPLTPREFGLLVALLRAAGAALSRAALTPGRVET